MNPVTKVSDQDTTRKSAGIRFTVALTASFLLVGGTLLLAESQESIQKPPKSTFTIPVEMLDQMDSLPGKLAPLPKVPIPKDNPQNPAKIKLGKMLFFESRLSLDKTMSCATCHDPDKGFADGNARAIGFKGKELGRHSPTVLNAAYNGPQFWDGRAPSLEEQAKGPILAAGEMAMPDAETVMSRIRAIPGYVKLFKIAFIGERDPLNYDNVGKAIASFERTIVTPGARFDQYMKGDKQALTLQEKRGLILFVSKGSCAQCHSGANFSDNKYHNLGVPQKGPLSEDLGRFHVSKDEMDKGAFKTPTVRNVALTAPYMHDGAFNTLEEVVEFYDQGGGSTDSNKSKKIHKLNLTDQEKKDLVSFLKALNGEYPKASRPELP